MSTTNDIVLNIHHFQALQPKYQVRILRPCSNLELFSCAESNANELEQRIFLNCIRIGTLKVRRLN